MADQPDLDRLVSAALLAGMQVSGSTTKEGQMSASTLIRWSGLAGIASAVFVIVAEGIARSLGLMSMEEMAVTPLAPSWVPLNCLELLGLALMLLATVGLYARLAAASGLFGVIGFLVTFLGTCLLLGSAWTNTFVPPAIAREAPALLTMHPPPSPLGTAFNVTAEVFGLGQILFGIVVLRARQLPSGGAILLIVAGVLVRITPMLPIYLPLEVVAASAAFAWLGYALWSGTGEPARATAGATSKITATTLSRGSGMTGIVAAVLVFIAEGVGRSIGLMRMEQMAVTPLSAGWVPLNILELLGLSLMLLAITGLYASQAEAIGKFGLAGFLVVFLGTSLLMGSAWANTFTPPVIARHAPAMLTMHPPPAPLGSAFVATAEVFGIGQILFGIAILLTRQLPRGGALLLLAGGVLTRVMPMLPIYCPLEVVATCAALIWLGYALWSGNGEPAPASDGTTLNTALLKRLVALRSVPTQVIVLTAAASYLGQVIASLQGWPLWAIVTATLLPWVPIMTRELVWTYRHYHWLALLYLLVVTQGGHFLEHVAQIYQIHVLGLKGPAAPGIFGALDVEWVHFLWNTWVLLTVGVLVSRFPRNPWLWSLVPMTVWHEVEHSWIMVEFIRSGVAGTPGLLASGGVIGGGLPLVRPDLHFLYNLAETVPLVMAFVWQLRHAYDDWLALAFPRLSKPVLTATSNRAESLQFAAGDQVVRQGDPADRFYIITQGEVTVTRQDSAGKTVQVATLGPGQFFGEIGLLADSPRIATVAAKTPLEVLALDRETFRSVTESSEGTAEDLAEVVRERMAAASA
jgi:hypothetical protein